MQDTANIQRDRLFVRDKLTWLGYLLIGFYCFVVAALGPIMPYLRAELDLNYTIAAMHFAAPATGALVGGILGERLQARLGRTKSIWCGGSGVVVGLIIALLGHNAYCTIFGAWLIGFWGSQMCQTVTAIMSDRFQEERAIGISESSIAAAVFSAFAPLVVSLVIRLGLNWRAALLLPIVLFLSLTWINRTTVQTSSAGSSKLHLQPGLLPPAYWAYFAVIFLSVSGEWSIVFWSADFLEKVVHLSKPDAAIGVSIFLASIFAGRIAGSRLTHTVPTRVLLPAAAVLAAVGFMAFWLGPTVPLHLIGLAIAGFGEANVYPLSLAAAIGVAPEQSAKATARMSIASGAAILSAPLLLGMLADRSGIGNAYGLVSVLLTLAAGTVLIANIMGRRHHERCALPVPADD